MLSATLRPKPYRNGDRYDPHGDDYSVSISFVMADKTLELLSPPHLYLYLQHQRKWNFKSSTWGPSVPSVQAGWQDRNDVSPIHTAAREAMEEIGLDHSWKRALVDYLQRCYTMSDPSLSSEIRLNRNGKLHYSFRLLVNNHAMTHTEKFIYQSLLPREIGCIGFQATRTSPSKERTEHLYWVDRHLLPPKTTTHTPMALDIRFDHTDVVYDTLSGHWVWDPSFQRIDTATRILLSSLSST
tara:strand:- start:626 stop:1348 length:723 start_codon:yes stop_codon:yes gene_type:complete